MEVSSRWQEGKLTETKLQKGDVVRLAQSVTMAEFGLALCDDDGAGLEIDGVVGRVEPHMVNVRIRRLMGSSSICDPTEGAVSRWVRRHEVLEVIRRTALMAECGWAEGCE